MVFISKAQLPTIGAPYARRKRGKPYDWTEGSPETPRRSQSQVSSPPRSPSPTHSASGSPSLAPTPSLHSPPPTRSPPPTHSPPPSQRSSPSLSSYAIPSVPPMMSLPRTSHAPSAHSWNLVDGQRTPVPPSVAVTVAAASVAAPIVAGSSVVTGVLVALDEEDEVEGMLTPSQIEGEGRRAGSKLYTERIHEHRHTGHSHSPDHDHSPHQPNGHSNRHNTNATSQHINHKHAQGAAKSTPRAVPKTFADLEAGTKSGHFVLRIHSATSFSPLVWTGDERTSGFAASNWHLGALTPTSYRGALVAMARARAKEREGGSNAGDMDAKSVASNGASVWLDNLQPWENWTAGPGLRQTLVDHMLRKPRLKAYDPGDGQVIPPDALSPWISTSGDTYWVVWEVARRLQMEAAVHVAIIALGSTTTHGEVPPGASGEVTLNPLAVLADHRARDRGSGDKGRMTHNEKDDVDKAITSVKTSSEVMFFGRVFAGSIIGNMTFTREAIPIELPRHLVTYPPQGYYAWTDALVWTPKDDFFTARNKMVAAERGWR